MILRDGFLGHKFDLQRMKERKSEDKETSGVCLSKLLLTKSRSYDKWSPRKSTINPVFTMVKTLTHCCT